MSISLVVLDSKNASLSWSGCPPLFGGHLDPPCRFCLYRNVMVQVCLSLEPCIDVRPFPPSANLAECLLSHGGGPDPSRLNLPPFRSPKKPIIVPPSGSWFGPKKFVSRPRVSFEGDGGWKVLKSDSLMYFDHLGACRQEQRAAGASASRPPHRPHPSPTPDPKTGSLSDPSVL